MATFSLTGRVVGFGGTTGNLPQLDLAYEISAGNFNRRSGFSQSGIIQTAATDTFSVNIDVPDNRIASLGPRSLLLITVTPFVPASNRRGARVSTDFSGTGQAIYDQIASAAKDLVVEVNLSDCRTLNIRAGINGTAPELDGVNELCMQLVSNPDAPHALASICARRDGTTFRGRLVCRRADIDASPTWILLHTRRAVPVSRQIMRQQDVGRIIVRTRALNGNQAITDAGDGIIFNQVDTVTGVGTISASLPDVIEEGVLFIRDLDLDFVNGNIRVRGRVGCGAFGVQLFGFGRFEVTLSVSLIDRDLLPFREGEFDTPLKVQILSSTYDISPDTDLDNLNIAETLLESFINGIVANTIRDRIRDAIHDELIEQIDDMFDAVTDLLSGITEDPEGLADDMRQTLFMHLDRVTIDADNINIRAFAGLWHFMAAFQTLDCAANAASAMFFSQRPLPMFRRYEKALSHKKLQFWNAAYKQHARELASIALRDPSLTSQVVRLGFDLQPILNEKGGMPLSADAVERLLHVTKLVRQHSSPELGEVLQSAAAVFRAGEGQKFEHLVELAAGCNPLPATKQSKRSKKAS